MLEVHLYGKLRRFTDNQDVTRDSVVCVPVGDEDTIGDVVASIGIPSEEVGSNLFLNWEYSALSRRVQDGDRLAVFPDDMQLLYKWNFDKKG